MKIPLHPLFSKGGEGGFDERGCEADLNDLFKTGIAFLEKLSHAVSKESSLQPIISSLIEKDEDTGKSYFKIPLPDEETISKAVSTFGRLLQRLRKQAPLSVFAM